MAYKIKIQFRRDTAANWKLNKHVVPLEGEPCFETDTGVFKIGDGVTPYGALTAIGVGMSEDSEIIQQYIQQVEELQKEVITVKETVEAVAESTIFIDKYEIVDAPAHTLVDIREKEIRIMCPADTRWELRPSGEGSQADTFYVGMKAFAPAEAISFKEDLAEEIADDTMYYFEGNDFAGVDSNGRKYSIVWLPVARYDSATNSWTYFGASSTKNHYVGWYYTVEWYGADGIISADSIRVNLSNENCHNNVKPFYYADTPVATNDNVGTVKGGDEISISEDGSLVVNQISFSKIFQDGEDIVFDGGSSGE